MRDTVVTLNRCLTRSTYVKSLHITEQHLSKGWIL